MNERESTAVDGGPNESWMDRRYRLNLPLIYSLFASTYNPPLEAVACNSSQRGLCFQSTAPLIEGQYICVRPGLVDPESSTADRTPVPVKAFALAQVRWCLSEPSAPAPAYTVGVEYL